MKVKTSVWNYFYLTKKKKGIKVQDYVHCKLCKKEIFKNTTRMVDHVEKCKNSTQKMKQEMRALKTAKNKNVQGVQRLLNNIQTNRDVRNVVLSSSYSNASKNENNNDESTVENMDSANNDSIINELTSSLEETSLNDSSSMTLKNQVEKPVSSFIDTMDERDQVSYFKFYLEIFTFIHSVFSLNKSIFIMYHREK